MRPKPACPTCSSLNVMTLGGGTHGKYRYACNECDLNGTSTVWQQIPPHRLQPTDSPKVKLNKNIKKRYRCKVCGLLKRGHVCGQSEQAEPTDPNDVDTTADSTTDDPALPMPDIVLPLAPVSLSVPFFNQSRSAQ